MDPSEQNPSPVPNIYAVNQQPQPSSDKKAKKKTKTSSACKECKRLKLKCDKRFPCGSCVKRGCSSICPDGVLVTGKGSRFVLSGSEALHDKIDSLTERIRNLEAAVEEAYPNSRHPLLQEDLLQIKNSGDIVNANRKAVATSTSTSFANPLIVADDEEESEEEGPGEQSGTLKIDESGSSSYFGATARTEYFLLGPDDLGLPMNPTPIEILLSSQSFPFTTLLGTQHDMARKLHSKLPPIFESERLAGIYHTRLNWMYDILFDSQQYIVNLQSDLYHSTKDLDLHRLAVLYMVHALGHLLDFDRDIYPAEAFLCNDLAKACLALKPILDFPSISSLQAMFLMCYFLLLGNKKPDACWTIMGIIVKIAQSLGIHRDDFKLTDEEAQERRMLWWELVTLEGWVSLGFGRPPAARHSTSNCKLPKYKPSTLDSGFRGWMHMFGRKCLPHVLDIALGTKPTLYSAITEVTKIVADSYVPPALEVTQSAREKPSSALTFQRALVLTSRALSTLKLHLGWFTTALSENPLNLRKSKYYSSVEAVHHSACTLIATLHHLTTEDFAMTCRFGLFWSNTLSAAVPLCLIATRAPSSEWAAHSLREVENCYDIFSRGSSAKCHIANASLPTLKRFRDKARQALQEQIDSKDPQSTALDSHLRGDSRLDDDEDELDRLGGKTNLVRGSGFVPSFESMPPPAPPSSNIQSHHEPIRSATVPQTDSNVDYRPSSLVPTSSVRQTSNMNIKIDQEQAQHALPPPLAHVAYRHQPLNPEPVYQSVPHQQYAEQQHHFTPHSYSQPSPINYTPNPVMSTPIVTSADYRYMSDPQTPRPPNSDLLTEASDAVHYQYPATHGHYYHPQPSNERGAEYQVHQHYSERAPIQQQHQEQAQWPTPFHDRSVFPPYTPPPMHSHQAQHQTELYEQSYGNDDDMLTSASSDGVWKEQQELYNTMVQQLHR